MTPSRVPLPADAVLPALAGALREAPAAVLRAPPGSGKTTRVPPGLLDQGLAPSGVVVLEPRRVAARAAARRVASERGSRVGEEVGYHVRFDQQVSRATRLRYVTDGVLLRMLLDDPCLEGTDVVVFDEFHERRLNSDLALGMVQRVRQTVRPDLKIVVMSATFDARAIADWLGGCPVIASDGGLFPVEVLYHPEASNAVRFSDRYFQVHLTRAVREAAAATQRGLLVFLPGVGEIRRARQELAELARRHALSILPLFGDLPPDEQDKVLAPMASRKLVLATNVAETSITIPDIEAVIDTGYERRLVYDDGLGIDRLELGRISRASADQRAGRAGRTGPGLCLRLWGPRDERGMSPDQTPEVRRVDLAGALLTLCAWGERDPLAFPWFEPPRAEAVERGQKLLEWLGATERGQLTSWGRAMARFPTHPRVSRLLLEGWRLGIPEEAVNLAVVLGERLPDELSAVMPEASAGRETESDVFGLLEPFKRALRADPRNSLIAGTSMEHVHDARRQLRDTLLAVAQAVMPASQTGGAKPVMAADEALLRTALAGYQDRLARRRETSSRRAVMMGGKGVRLHANTSVVSANLFVCVDVGARAQEGDLLVKVASGVRREWLDPARFSTRVEARFDARAQRVQAVHTVCYEDLVLEEGPASNGPAADVAQVLARAAAEQPEAVLPRDRAFTQYVARVNCLRDWMPELDLPAFDEAFFAGLLPDLCLGRRSFDELRQAPWLDTARQRLTFHQRQAVELEAPERCLVPSGSRLPIDYQPRKRPVLAVKIQELFGLAETPRIAGGRVPLLLHLLAPNGRPQQVTDDLRSFWNTTYQQVRKDLRGRYPKHAWPEDPWNAAPQRRPRRA